MGVSEIASVRVEETSMRVFTESEFKTEMVKCPALDRRRILWWRQACGIRNDGGSNMRTDIRDLQNAASVKKI